MTYTREQVYDILEAMLRKTSNHETSASAGYRTAVREVLRRLDALPNPPAPSPARGITRGFRGVLEAETASAHVAGDGVSPDSHHHQLRILMFRFPDGSLAPYVEATEGAPYEGACLMPLAELVHLMRNVGHMEAFQIGNRAALPNPQAAPENSPESKRPILDLHGLRGAAKRPRATTPTPEVPALKAYVGKDECAVCEQERGKLHLWHCVWKDPDHYEDSDGTVVKVAPAPKSTVPEVPALKATCEYGNHCWADGAVDCMCGKMASRVPTAPEVVWSGDGLSVYANGTYSCDPEVLEKSVDGLLARALAEAKLDARLARASLAAEREALRQTDVALAEAKREVEKERDAAHEYESELKQKTQKAAESMRERAALILDKYIRIENPDAITNTIRALPLEEP